MRQKCLENVGASNFPSIARQIGSGNASTHFCAQCYKNTSKNREEKRKKKEGCS